MSYFLNYDPDAQTASQGSGQPIVGGGGAAAPAAVPVSGGGGGAQAQQQAPTGQNFVNFSRVQAANGDAAARTSQQLQKSITDKGNAANQGIQNAWGSFQGAANAGGLGPPPPKPWTPPTASNQAGATAGRVPLPAKQLAPTMNMGSMSDDQLKGVVNQQYTGPQGLSSQAGFPDLVSQVQDAAKRAGLADTSEGRQALLSDQYGTSGGGNRLDEALIGGGGAWGGLRQRFGGLNDTLSRYGNAATNLANEEKAGMASGSAAAQRELDARADGKAIADHRNSVLAQEAADAKSASQSANGAVRGSTGLSQLGGGHPTPRAPGSSPNGAGYFSHVGHSAPNPAKQGPAAAANGGAATSEIGGPTSKQVAAASTEAPWVAPLYYGGKWLSDKLRGK